MRRMFGIELAIPLLALAIPVAAQTFLQPQPLSRKYSDHAVKPATGRSGAASLALRGLLSRTGKTDLELTTGILDSPGAAPGKLAKIQVKLMAPNGGVLQTRNYTGLTQTGYADVVYDGLHRRQPVQVQANVTGIEPHRTDMVTLATEVALRPDLEATGLDAPPIVPLNAPVTVGGRVSETNGDVGAHATCTLRVDGAETGTIAGIWVDAGTTVTCHFTVAFATPGVHQLAFVVGDVLPADDDATNNTYSAQVVAANPQLPTLVSVMFSDQYDSNYTVVDERYTFNDGGVGTRETQSWWDDHMQLAMVVGQFRGDSPDAGTVWWRFLIDGTQLDEQTIDTSTLPQSDPTPNGVCRFGYFGILRSLQVCSGNGYTLINAGSVAGKAVYRADSIGSGLWYGGDWSVTDEYDYLALVPLGTTITAELRHESAGMLHGGSVSTGVAPFSSVYDTFGNPSCYVAQWPEGTDEVCSQFRNTSTGLKGTNTRFID